MKTSQELGFRRSHDCSSKEKRYVRSSGVRVKRTSEVKGTTKQTNKQTNKQTTRQPSKGSHRAQKLPLSSDRKACGEVATAA
jgi:hypothetical protein